LNFQTPESCHYTIVWKLPGIWYSLFLKNLFSFFIWIGVHCGIYKSSYNISNIS
jgi:hypothetical protein